MFSGIVEDVGEVTAVIESADGVRFTIKAEKILGDAMMGESISVSGACLTVVRFTKTEFDVELTNETLRCTTLGDLKQGSRVNLEKALKLGDRLGGHMVTGHVDTVGRVKHIKDDGFSKLITFTIDPSWAGYFVKKGSVTVEGVSLTVADCGSLTYNSSASESDNEFWFSVALIPHTMDVTTLGALFEGQRVNVETDVIARYVVRLLGEGYMENLNKERESVL